MKIEYFRKAECNLLMMIFIIGIFTLPFLTAFSQSGVEKWRVFEITLKGSNAGNPFTEVQVGAVFTNGKFKKTVQGFYNGNSIYKIRFMPEETGIWSYVTSSNAKSLQSKKGNF